MQYGVIKSIQPDRGFGFIDTGGHRDVYFHATEIGDDVFQRLMPNQPVMFEFAKRADKDERDLAKGPRAALVKLIEKLPGGTLPRPTQDIAPRHHPKARQRKATWKRKIDLRKKEH
jgi:cold shock CspA family protein